MTFSKKLLPAALGSVITLGLVACNSGNSNIDGTFVDDPVIGLPFRVNGGDVQLTSDNPAGGFSCESGDTVLFGLGDNGAGGFNLTFGEANCSGLISPIDLVPGATDSSDPNVQKIAQLLQSADDGSSAGNLTIPQSVRDAADALDVASLAAEIDSFEDTSACDDNVTAYANLADTLVPGLSTGGAIGCATAATNLDDGIAEANGEDTGGDTGGTGEFFAGPCFAGEDPVPATLDPNSSLAGVIANFETVVENPGSPFALGEFVEYTFSSSGLLQVNGETISDTPYVCPQSSLSEVLWSNEAQNLTYAMSFGAAGSDVEFKINEVNVLDATNNDFLAQTRDTIPEADQVQILVPFDAENPELVDP